MPSRTDDLTGLPNRLGLIQALEGRLADGGSFAVLRAAVRDPDRIPRILGAAGSASWLRHVGQRLAGAAGYESLARLEGTEFALIAPAHGQADAGVIASRLADDLSWPVPAGGMHLRVATRIGVALAPHDGEDATTLVRRAGAARRRAEALDLAWCGCR